MKYISNAFSLGMLPYGASPKITELPKAPGQLQDYVSVVGHPDTAKILGVAFNRVTLKLQKGDQLLIAQYDGPRLPEGATELPEGASFRWFLVEL